jgi:UDP-N-acetylmuramate--alanine ligase
VPGRHNVINAAAAASAAYLCGIDGEIVADGISSFPGVKRRFEKKGIMQSGAVVIDDYAHHPDEITATLSAAKKVCKGRVYCIFQPHTYTRFEVLMEDFAKALSLADSVIMTDIYAAREKNINGTSSADIKKYLPQAYYFDSFEKAADFVKNEAKRGDMVITMGAGDVYEVADFLI